MTTFRRLLCVAVVGIGCGLVPHWASAQASQVPGPSMTITIDSVQRESCNGGLAGPLTEQWLQTYGPAPCYQPTGTTAGQFFIASVRVTATATPLPAPQVTPAPIVTLVPRASVTRFTDAASCAPAAPPCLRVKVPSQTVPATVSIAFLDGEGRVASVDAPFAGAPKPAIAPATGVDIR